MDILEAEKIFFSQIAFQRGSNTKAEETIEAKLVIADALSKQHKTDIIINNNDVNCPKCGCRLGSRFLSLLEKTPYCKLCGQKLNWRKLDK